MNNVAPIPGITGQDDDYLAWEKSIESTGLNGRFSLRNTQMTGNIWLVFVLCKAD